MCGEVGPRPFRVRGRVEGLPEPGRYACWGLRTAVLREQCVGGVKFIGSSELWCSEVVKLLSYNTRRGRAEDGRSLVVYCFCLFTSLPCLGLFTTKRPLNTRIFTVRKTPFIRISLQDKRSIYIAAEIFFSGCARPFLERAGESTWRHPAPGFRQRFLFGSSANMIAERSGANADNTQGNMNSMHNFGWRTSVE